MVSQIEGSLKAIFDIRPSAKQLREIIPRLRHIVEGSTSKTRRRCDIMEWMKASWIRIEPTLGKIAQKRGSLDENLGSRFE
jgi:hypothetical protein